MACFFWACISKLPQSPFHSVLRNDQMNELQAILRQYLAPMTSTSKWPWTLNTNRSKVPHIHTTITSELQISLHFTLWPAVFDLPAIWRQVHLMTPKWPLTLNAQRYPIHGVTVLESQISLRFTLRLAISKILAIFHFPIDHNDKFQSFFIKKNWIWNFKIPIPKQFL